jgi:hypothetical protein
MGGSLSEAWLRRSAISVARTFAADPKAISVSMESTSRDAHVLFTLIPNDERSGFTLRITTPHLCDLVRDAIVRHDAAHRAWFYRQASDLPQFQGTLGFIFEKYFLAWIHSEQAAPIPCTAKSSRFGTPAADLTLRPLGPKNLSVFSGDSEFAKAKDSDTPFGWLPATRTFPSFDAIICTETSIITIQATVSSKHSMSPKGFRRLKEYLPKRFERARTWRHVFLTDLEKNAPSLRAQYHKVADRKNISIYSAVLDVSKFNFSSEDLMCVFTPSVCIYILTLALTQASSGRVCCVGHQ